MVHSAGIIAVLGLLCAGASVCAPASAQDNGLPASPPGEPVVTSEVQRPAAAGRVVQIFDFEERAFNAEPVPRFWVRAQHDLPTRERPGFPPWNQGAFSDKASASGAMSVYLPVSGGNTSLRLGANVIPIFPDADLLISAKVRTDRLKVAKAVLAARLVDQSGNAVDGSEMRTEPISSPSGWSEVSVRMLRTPPAGAYVQIELLVLQPSEFADEAVIGHHRVVEQDLSGGAWFDDVAVYQLPRLSIAMRDTLPVVVAPAQPELVATVRDLAGERLIATIDVRDDRGVVVDQLRRELTPGGGLVSYSPSITRLGWYGVELTVAGEQGPRHRATTAFVVVPKDLNRGLQQLTQSQRTLTSPFVLLSPTITARHVPSAASMLAVSGAGGVNLGTMPMLTAAFRQQILTKSSPYVDFLEALFVAGYRVDLTVKDLPGELAVQLKLDPDDPLALAMADESIWLPRLQEVVDRYGQRIGAWHFGALPFAVGNPAPQQTLPRLAKLQAMLSKLTPGPVISLPWRADWPPLTDMYSSLPGRTAPVVVLPGGIALRDVGAAIGPFVVNAASAAPVTIVLQHAEAQEFGHASAVADLTRRAVLAWATLDPAAATAKGALALAEVARLALPDPWQVNESDDLVPTATLAAFANLSRRLQGRSFVGDIETTPGVTALVFAGADAGSSTPGMIVAWNSSAEAPASGSLSGLGPTLNAYLGEGAITVADVYGNTAAARPADANKLYRIGVGDAPVFIEGVDPALVRFIAGYKISPDFAPAVAATHEHQIVLTNPWPARISGTIQLVLDDASRARGWNYNPVTAITFAIAPGETVRLPFSMNFPPSEESGRRSINAIVRLTADRQYPPMRMSASIDIGLADMDLVVVTALSPGADGPDVIVTATVTNTGTRPRTLQVDATAPQQSQQRQPVSELGAGESAARRFVFTGAAKMLSGKRVRVSLIDSDRAERLNKMVVVP